MTASGWSLPRATGALNSPRRARLERFGVPALALRVIPFVLLAAFASMHWAALVEPHQTRRALIVTASAAALGVALASSGGLPRVPGVVLRIALVLAATVLAVLAVGVPLRLFEPNSWDTLADRVNGGLAVVGGVSEWPYDGPNVWLRLTTLLAMPLVLMLAATLTFWPRSDTARPVSRAFALVLLVALYGVAVAARPFEHDALRGVGLLACLAAWLWLPRLTGRDALAAGAAVVIAGGAALALTPQLASSEPWVDYRQWSWTLNREKTISFDWRHSYGPLDWPRKGTTLLLIKSKDPQYWKAQALDKFDGVGWTTGPMGGTPGVDALVRRHPKWVEPARVTVRGLRSEMVIGPGALIKYRDVPGEPVFTSYGLALAGTQLESGDSYSVLGYTPDPSRRQMRAAPLPSPALEPFTTISVSDPGDFARSILHLPLRNQPGTGNPGALEDLLDSRYARVYELAQRITATATTDYDMVRMIGAYLEKNYDYTERVPRREFPLEAFLFQDKKGYCQQFSGAAALMLRMLGVPARVASGFAPGTLDNETKEYVVRDLDAHSWIEVWFEGIGWVPFDPTPAAAPASSQAGSFQPRSENASAARGSEKDELPPRLRAEILGAANSGAGAGATAAEDEGMHWAWVAAGVVAGLLALAALIVTLMTVRARRRHPLPPPCGDADVDYLVRLLARLGIQIGPGTTLLELEDRMRRLGGPEAAAYAGRLRRRRYGGSDDPCPDRAERRRLRQALAESVGAGPLARCHLAAPELKLRGR